MSDKYTCDVRFGAIFFAWKESGSEAFNPNSQTFHRGDEIVLSLLPEGLPLPPGMDPLTLEDLSATLDFGESKSPFYGHTNDSTIEPLVTWNPEAHTWESATLTIAQNAAIGSYSFSIKIEASVGEDRRRQIYFLPDPQMIVSDSIVFPALPQTSAEKRRVIGSI